MSAASGDVEAINRILKHYEGKIYVNSIEGDFTEFTLFIPKIMEEL